MNKNYTDLIERFGKKEKEFLGRLMSVGMNDIIQVSQIISPRDFRHLGKSYECVLEYKLKGEDFEVFTRNGITVSDFVSDDSFRNIFMIAKELKNISVAVRLILFLNLKSEEVKDNNLQNLISDIQKEIVGIDAGSTKENPEIKKIMDDFSEVTKQYQSLPPGSLLGIPTGMPKLDEAIDGIRAPHFWIIGAYTSMGKTFFMLNLLLSLLKQNKKVVLYSLEMSKIDIAARLMGMLTSTEGKKILKGETSTSIEEARLFLSGSSLRVINERRELSKICLSMTEECMADRVDVFFVDYLQQIFDKDSDSEYDSMRVAATEFQKLAEKYNKPIIALSQISNEAAKSPDSQVMGFKGSGTIAAACDLALELWHGEEDKHVLKEKLEASEPILMKVMIKKNRHGRTGSFKMLFDGRTGIFSEPRPDFEEFIAKVNKK